MPPGRVHRILAVDDIETNLLTLRAILPPEEFSFRGCSGAEEAFQALEQGGFDLVLLDVMLPGLDGYAIARRLKADPKTASVPVIFVTALAQEDEVVRGFEAGGVDFVSKPFRKAELLLRLRTHLALRDKNDALERAADELRRANLDRDQFFSILAHDLKNPLAGYLSLVRESVQQFDRIGRDELMEILQAMEASAQNVYRLLETLLDWGRAQTGALRLEIADQPAPFLIDEALEPLEEGFRRKEIRVEVDAVPLLVRCDRVTGVTILRNLLSNAQKFTRPGGLVKAAVRPTSAGTALFTVEDNGVGIPEARLKKLFRFEEKLSTPGTARELGTGLGLVLCADFARRNGGSIRAESRPGEGSRFSLELPASGLP